MRFKALVLCDLVVSTLESNSRFAVQQETLHDTHAPKVNTAQKHIQQVIVLFNLKLTVNVAPHIILHLLNHSAECDEVVISSTKGSTLLSCTAQIATQVSATATIAAAAAASVVVTAAAASACSVVVDRQHDSSVQFVQCALGASYFWLYLYYV
jgi:hypothetical protein